MDAGLWFLGYMYGLAAFIAMLSVPIYVISKRFF